MTLEGIVRDNERIKAVAGVLKEMPEVEPFNFADFGAGTMYPDIGDDKAVEFFSGHGVHQFGFWCSNGIGYDKPFVGMINSREEKGSDYAWLCSMRALKKNRNFFSPKVQTELSLDDVREWFADDSGICKMPMIEEHWKLANAYGKKLLEDSITPDEILAKANSLSAPLKAFLSYLENVPGYAEDPLKKKSTLLALELSARPEKFLKVEKSADWKPIIDYHNQRVMLRMGLVKVGFYEEQLKKREWVTENVHNKIREEVYLAVQDVINLSGKSMAAVDWYFFKARKYCPEMQEPNHDNCALKDVCAKNSELFQPIFRTNYY